MVAAYFTHSALDSAQVFDLVDLARQLRVDGYDLPAEALEQGNKPIVDRFWKESAVAGAAGLRATASVAACLWGYHRGRTTAA